MVPPAEGPALRECWMRGFPPTCPPPHGLRALGHTQCGATQGSGAGTHLCLDLSTVVTAWRTSRSPRWGTSEQGSPTRVSKTQSSDLGFSAVAPFWKPSFSRHKPPTSLAPPLLPAWWGVSLQLLKFFPSPPPLPLLRQVHPHHSFHDCTQHQGALAQNLPEFLTHMSTCPWDIS